MNNYVLLVLDSCRYDSMQTVWNELINIPRIGKLHKAYTLSTWTLTSHLSFAIGRLPWIETRKNLKKQKTKLSDPRDWETRLGIPITQFLEDDFNFKNSLNKFGYKMRAITSARPIEPQTPLKYFVNNIVSVGNRGNTLERILKLIDNSWPIFYILNTYETHYPYFDGSYDPKLKNYYIGGYRSQIEAAKKDKEIELPVFKDDLYKILFRRQCSAIKYIDKIIPRLYAYFPSNTFITITADHGDCFGEDGFIGHAEVAHKKVLEVPFIEGLINKI